MFLPTGNQHSKNVGASTTATNAHGADNRTVYICVSSSYSIPQEHKAYMKLLCQQWEHNMAAF